MRQPTYDQLYHEECYQIRVFEERLSKGANMDKLKMSMAERKDLFNQASGWLEQHRIGINCMGMIIALEALGYLRTKEEVAELSKEKEPVVHPV